MTQHPVPSELGKFLGLVLGRSFGEDTISLQSCKVAELKQVLTVLHRMPFFCNNPSLLPLKRSLHRNKDSLIMSTLQILFTDFPSCQIMRQEAIQDINNYHSSPRPSSSSSSSAATTTTSTVPTTATFPPASFHHPMNHAIHHSNQQAFMWNTYSQQLLQKQAKHLTHPHHSNQHSSPLPLLLLPKKKASSTGPSTPTTTTTKKRSPTRNNNNSPSKSQKKIHIKLEPRNLNETPMQSIGGSMTTTTATTTSATTLLDTMPQNSHESILTTELLEMGFTDRAEILWSVRKLAQTQTWNQLSSEEVMVDIITNREENDEARKMDEARKLSEQSRKEESKRLRMAIAQKQVEERKQAKWSEWIARTDMYSSSWLLMHKTVQEKLQCHVDRKMQIKETFMEMLDLEKKARKWYGPTLPRSYFRGNLVQQLSTQLQQDSKDQHVLDVLNKEIQILKEAMFTLSVQQGGVPKLFIDAHDSPTVAIDDKGNNDDDDDDANDEEIVVIRVDGGMSAEKDLFTPKSLRISNKHHHHHHHHHRTPEIIEIE